MRLSLRAARSMVVGLVLACGLAACDKASDEHFEQVTIGMSEGEVQGLMGKGEVQEVTGMSVSGAGVASGSSNAGSDRRTLTWHSDSSHKDYSVTFQAGKVVDKSKM
ncbi:MAG: hypothetical protein WC718_11195 [Phycisphaerales bacterium]|jgi:hypothetical protein